jgi:hypothetical protein
MKLCIPVRLRRRLHPCSSPQVLLCKISLWESYDPERRRQVHVPMKMISQWNHEFRISHRCYLNIRCCASTQVSQKLCGIQCGTHDDKAEITISFCLKPRETEIFESSQLKNTKHRRIGKYIEIIHRSVHMAFIYLPALASKVPTEHLFEPVSPSSKKTRDFIISRPFQKLYSTMGCKSNSVWKTKCYEKNTLTEQSRFHGQGQNDSQSSHEPRQRLRSAVKS